ncbi:MAG: pre-peptidase [Planctomycetota bacterium]|nr:MAG: pre-peptidase [Planctomycetota bacterium]
MRLAHCFVVTAIVALGIASTASAQTAFPMLMSLKPVAVQVGTTSEITVNSRYSMHNAESVLVTGGGVLGEVVPPELKKDDKAPNVTALKIKLTVAADALPGVRDVRVLTPQGISTVAQLVVVEDPVIVEQAKNDTAAEAQPITLPATVCGCIEKAEDIDFFKFKIDAPTSLVFHVRSQRLQDRIHDLQAHSDPILTIRSAQGSTIAAADNVFQGDPFLSHRFEQPGEYLLEIRDVRYTGNQYWEYAVEIHSRPFVRGVFPLAVAAGKETKLTAIGSQLLADPAVTFTPPSDLPSGIQRVRLPFSDRPSNPVAVYSTPLPMISETADDNNDAVKSLAAPTSPIIVPCVINGRIETPADVDCFVFEAKKDDKLSFEVKARRLQSELDSTIRIVNDKGATLVENDDLRLGKRGSENFVYAIELTHARPYFNLYADTDKTNLSPGVNGVMWVKVERKNGFTGAVQLHVDGLPSGILAECGRILPDKGNDGCIVFKATAEAGRAVAPIVIRGTAAHAQADGQMTELAATATTYQEIYNPGGGRNHWPVDQHVLAVVPPHDIRAIKLSKTDITLKPGESQTIDVTIDRAPDFKANISLDVTMTHLALFADTLPPGVTLDGNKSKTLLSNGATQGTITLTASKDAAPIERQLIGLTANISLNFVVKTTFAAEPVFVTVAKP